MAKKTTRKKAATVRQKRQSAAAKAQRQANFLERFVELGSVHAAAVATGIERKTHYRWLGADEEYAAAFADAEVDAVDRLAAEALRRAVQGVVEPVIYKGKVVTEGLPDGGIRRYSDTLLIFLLKARDPAKYRDRIEHRHGNAEGEGPLQLHIVEEIITASSEVDREEDSAAPGSG